MKRNVVAYSLLAGSLLVLPACTDAKNSKNNAVAQEGTKKMDLVTTQSGLQYHITKPGTGAVAQKGQNVTVHYTGWLYENGQKGTKFDSSVDRGTPFSFPLGQGYVIKGWDEGVAGMKIGEKRTLIIPANLGYGARGAGGIIKPNATLMFDVELISVGQ